MAENRGLKAEEIIALSKKEGFLARQLYVVFTTPTNGIGPVMENVKEHLAFQVRLEKEGTCLPRVQIGPTTRNRGTATAWSSSGLILSPMRKKALNAIRCTKVVHENSKYGHGL